MNLPAVSVVAALWLSASAVAAEFSVLPLGDSITDGTQYGGYRARMVADLTGAGHTVHLLGSQTMADGDHVAASLRPPHDGLHHEGHGGWRIDQLDASLDAATDFDAGGHGGYFLAGGHGTGRAEIHPDVILLLAGINDVNQYFGAKEKAGRPVDAKELLSILQTRITSIVDKIRVLRPRAETLLGTVIPYANGLLKEQITGATKGRRKIWAKQDGVSPEQELGVNHFVILYNHWLRDEFVPQQRARGVKITLVDQYRNFILADGTVRGWGPDAPNGYGDFGLHPNQAGYDLMGATWAEAILELPR